MKRYKLTIEYDGTGFSGWQRQGQNVRSVQQTIEEAFTAFCQQTVSLTVAGRTDAGVHAQGQVAHVDFDYGPRPLTPHDLRKALNAYLRESGVVVLEAEEVDDTFNARFSALNKLYTYTILNRAAPPALTANRVWHVWQKLDMSAMQNAAKFLLGKHDFSSFRAVACQAKTPVRTLDRLDVIQQSNELICIHAEGRSFLHHQVRNMVGTLVEIGLGKRAPEDMQHILQACDRTQAGQTAPPQGLCLVRIDY